jgi:hypothetical protein
VSDDKLIMSEKFTLSNGSIMQEKGEMTINNFLFIRLVMPILLVQALFVTSVSAHNNWETVEVTFTGIYPRGPKT